MRDVYVLGSYTTRFQHSPHMTHQLLAREAVEGVLKDAGLADGGGLGGIWFGSCALHLFGQANLRGQTVLLPLVREKRVKPTAPIINVEAAGATGAVALHGAYASIASGGSDLALALGVEKTFMPKASHKMDELLEQGLDQLQPELWRALYAQVAAELGVPFDPSPDRSTLLDIAALEAQWHMKRHGTTREQLAAIAAKNHTHGSKNPKAHHQTALTAKQVLAEEAVIGPFTPSMCAPLSDGAAAVLLGTKKTAVRVAAMALANGARWHPDEKSVTLHAAKRAGLEPSTLDIAEVHDSTAFAELAVVQTLAFSKAVKVNPSGGLEARGHPLAATGLAQIAELHARIRSGEAQTGLAHNAGGIIGFDEAMCAITILRAS